MSVNLSTQKVYGSEILHKNGKRVELEVSIHPIRADNPAHVVAILRDITARKQAEEALAASEAQYRNFYENVHDVIYRTDYHGVITDISPSLEKRFDYRREQVIGRRVEEFFFDRQDYAALDAAMERSGAVNDFEIRLKHKDGRPIPVSVTSRIVFDAQGRPIATEGVLRDITERKQAEEALRESEEKYRMIVENVDEIVYRVTLQADPMRGTVVFVSPQVETILGYSPDEFSVDSGLWFRNIHPGDIAGLMETTQKMLTSHKAVTREYRLRYKETGEYRWMEDKVAPLFDLQRTVIGYQGAARDITDRKRAEEALQETSELLETVFSNTHLMLAYLDREFNFVRVNSAYAEADQRSPDFFPGQNHFALYPNAENQAIFQNVVDSGETYFAYAKPFEYAEHPERGISYWDWSLVPVKDAAGRVSHLILGLINVTERVRAEARLRRFWDLPLIGMAITSTDRRFLEVNRKFADMMGYAVSELVGKAWPDVTHPDDVAENVRLLEETLAGKTDEYSMEKRFIRRDGSHLHAHIAARCIRRADGAVDHLALVIQDITEREQHERERGLLDRVRMALARELNLPTTLRTIVESIAETFGYTLVSLYLRRGETLVLQDQVGYSQVIREIPITQGISGRVASTQQPLLIEDVRTDPEFLAAMEGIVSEVCVPLFDEGKVVGTLNVESTQGIQLSKSDLNLMTALGEHVSLAIARARLFDEIQRRADEFAALYALSTAGTEASDMDTLIERATQIIGGTLYPDNFGVLLLDEASGDLLVHPSYHNNLGPVSPMTAEVIPAGQGVAGRVVATGRPIRVPDIRLEPAYFGDPYSGSELCVPLKTSARLLGVINAESVRLNAFTEADERLLTTIAEQLAIALEKIRLLDETRRRADEFAALYETTRDLAASQDLSALLQTITERAAKLLSTADAVIYLYDPVAHDLETAATLIHYVPIGTHISIGQGASGRVIRTRQPVVIDDYQNWEERREIYEGKPIASVAQVPMIYGGEIIGVLGVGETQLRRFTDSEVRLLELLASQAASAVHNARLFEAIKSEHSRLQLLYDHSRAQGETLDVSAILGSTVRLTTRALSGLIGVAYLLEPSTQRLRLRAIFGSGEGSAEELDPRINFSVGDGLMGWVAQQRTPALVEDVLHDARWKVVPGLDEGIRAAVCVPILSGDQLLGVLGVTSATPHAFGQIHIELLIALSNQVSIALTNARLFEEARTAANQFGLLYDAGLALNSVLEPAVQLDYLIKIAMTTLRADRVRFFRLDAERNELFFEAGLADSPEIVEKFHQTRFRVGGMDSVTGWVAKNRVLVNLPDVRDDPRWARLDPGVRSGLWTPVLHGNQLIGVLNVMRTRIQPFTPAEERLLALFANQVAVALENARLFEEARQRGNEFAALYETNRDLASLQDLSTLLKTIVERTAALLGTSGGIYLYDTVRGDLEMIVATDTSIPIGIRLQMGEGMAGLVAQSRQPLIVDDYKIWEHRSRQYETIPFRAVAEVPMLYGGELIGVLVAHYSGDVTRKFTEGDVHLLSLFAAQAAIAVHNARMVQETRRHVEELDTLAHFSSALRVARTLDEMLPVLVQQAAQVVGGIAGVIFLVEPATGDLVARAWHRLDMVPANGDPDKPLRHHAGEGIAGYVAMTGKVYITQDLQHDSLSQVLSGENEYLRDVRCLICVPLRTHEQVIGVMQVGLLEQHSFTEGEMRLLTAITEIAANALHRAALHEQTERDAMELALAYDATLAGWSRALELRDKETEGHSERVTEMTLRLGRAVGLSEEELVHVRRGVLVHDLGKMGVPDSILLKPGPLSDAEWEIMRRHPAFAYEMLSPIAYLRPALDIPYCHHEKWDGTGYPRGLKGEEIPLPARLFAVVDVWDALCSDRPYRNAWSDEKVREYIVEQSGKHFDPNVVDAFLRLAF